MFSDTITLVIVFNSPLNSLQLQEMFHCTNFMANDGELNPGLVIKMADVLHKKSAKNGESTAELQRLYLKKNNSSSVVELLKTVTLRNISETDLIIQSDYPFQPGTNLHFKKPVEMFVNVVPVAKPSGKFPEFYGIIHCIGENEKKELRRYVNAIFFRDHDAQVSAESLEFKNLNELKLKEKLNALRKLKEAEEAKAQEKALAAERKAGSNAEVAAAEVIDKTSPPKTK